MQTVKFTKIASLALAAACTAAPVAAAQSTPAAIAPVPRQILEAKRVFISNAGGDSYGSESYFRLTRFDGGPDRFYDQFYAAVKRTGRYELSDGPADADIVYEVRFTTPIVDRQSPTDFVYDPQLTVTILDPKTRVKLWTLTEHIESSRDKTANDRSFDQAVDRIVDDAQTLATSSDAARLHEMSAAAPVGAAAAAERQQRTQHAQIGSVIGGIASGLLAASVAQSCAAVTNCTTAQGHASILHAFEIAISGGFMGGLIGWLWPLAHQ
jgi:hypothetical protein